MALHGDSCLAIEFRGQKPGELQKQTDRIDGYANINSRASFSFFLNRQGPRDLFSVLNLTARRKRFIICIVRPIVTKPLTGHNLNHNEK